MCVCAMMASHTCTSNIDLDVRTGTCKRHSLIKHNLVLCNISDLDQ